MFILLTTTGNLDLLVNAKNLNHAKRNVENSDTTILVGVSIFTVLETPQQISEKIKLAVA